jgi:hypothetical protein
MRYFASSWFREGASMNHSGDYFSAGGKALKPLYRVALCLLVVNLFAPLVSGQRVQPDQRVSLIRQRYNTINRRLATYRIVKKSGIEIDSESGGNLEAYLAAKEIKKIIFRLNSESSRWQMEYYYWKGKLIFVYHKKVQMNMQTMRPESTEERRMYFEDGKLIKLLVDKSDVSLTDAKFDEEYKSEVENTLRLSDDLIARVRAR